MYLPSVVSLSSFTDFLNINSSIVGSVSEVHFDIIGETLASQVLGQGFESQPWSEMVLMVVACLTRSSTKQYWHTVFQLMKGI